MTETYSIARRLAAGSIPGPGRLKLIDQAASCQINVKTALLPQKQQLCEADILKAFNASSTRCEDNEGPGAERLREQERQGVTPATPGEVRDLRREASALKEVVAEPVLESRLLKKARSGLGKTAHEIPRLRKAREMSTWGM